METHEEGKSNLHTEHHSTSSEQETLDMSHPHCLSFNTRVSLLVAIVLYSETSLAFLFLMFTLALF